MKARAIIRLDFQEEKQLETILTSLNPEILKSATSRSRTELKRNNKAMFLKVEANDSVALRAALNAYLRWINSIVKLTKFLEKNSNLQCSLSK